MEKIKVMLDTSAYSAFLRGNADIARLVQESDEIYLNPVVLGELIAGFIQGGREKKNRETLKDFLSSSRVKVVDVDDETSERYAAIITYLRTRGTPIPTNDLWIAATAMQYGLKLLTTDAHYRNIPQVIVECCAV
jgi:predicted nucleic acid-binding protein